MNESIKLNNEVAIDVPKLIDSRLLIQANSGGGKSQLLRRILEQSHGKVQQIVIDPEGEFSTLREKFDYILVGEGGDMPAESRSAALLARKLLELNVSAIIDLYELPPQERKHFVKLFLDSMINAPKDLWHSCIVVLDEAHVFAPEKGESEALGSVIDLASRGRKRGYCAVIATQRISKLSKDAAAECNNKLIGRATMDIDMKRAGEELGFTSKDQFFSLRQLDPGEFFAFGPAISKEVIKLVSGPVETTHPKAGSRIVAQVLPPTDKIKSVLKKLTDLPQEAEKELRTIAEFKMEITQLRRDLTQAKKANPNAPVTKIERIEVPAVGKRTLEKLKVAERNMRRMMKEIKDHSAIIETSVNKFSADLAKFINPMFTAKTNQVSPKEFSNMKPGGIIALKTGLTPNSGELTIGKGEKQILMAVAQSGSEGITREHLTVLTGYKRSSRDTYLQRLRQRVYVVEQGDKFFVTNAGQDNLGSDFRPLPAGKELRDHYLATLPAGEKKIFESLILYFPNPYTRDQISVLTGYQRSSRDTYLQRLNSRQLIKINRFGEITAAEKLFE